MGIYRAGRLVNVRSGGNLVSDSVVSGESAQARRGPSRDDSSALHRWWAILDFWRRIISNQSEQAPGVGRFLTPSPANTAKRIVVASFSFCVSLVSDEEALNWIDQREKSIRSVQQAGAKDKDRVKQEPSAPSKWAKLKRAAPKEAQVVIEKWRVAYNTKRLHKALGYRPLAPAACSPLESKFVFTVHDYDIKTLSHQLD
jgi:hypothetical protein